MKKQILNLVSILSLVIAVIILAIGLGNTRQQLLKAEARIRLLEFDNITKTAENIRLDCELAEAKAKLTATEQAVKMLGEMAQMKETELNQDLTIVRAECLRLIMEKNQTISKKWVPEWIGPGILKPIEPKDLRTDVR